MLELPSVTLICIDCQRHALALAAIEQSMLRCRFAEVVWFTDQAPVIDELRVVPIEPLTTAAQRFRFVAQRVAEHVATSHVLLIQWDAFVVNPSAWRDDFLDYDYIAPRASSAARLPSGDEGIALMSTRILRALALTVGAGDDTIGIKRTVDQAARHDARTTTPLRIAPRSMRNRFAFGEDPPVGQPFGFQGVYNMWMYLRAADLGALLQMATPDVLASPSLFSLAANLRDLGRLDEAHAVLAAILRADPAHGLARAMQTGLQPGPGAAGPGAAGLGVAGMGAVGPGVVGPGAGATIGRNDPCPCGSGRKYKQCHGALAGAPAVVPMHDAQPLKMTDATAAPQNPVRDEPFVAFGHHAVLFSRAQQAFERNDLVAADAMYRAILERRPDDPAATGYLGVIATRAHRFDDAEQWLARALRLDDQAPEIHHHLGLLRHAQGDFAAAALSYRRALELAPDYALAFNNLGLALQESAELDAAIQCYRTVVRLLPDFADAHWNLGLALIASGEFEEGLREHEWRLKAASQRDWWAGRQQFPWWQGEPLAGKRILLLDEQGLGDAIVFVRYAKALAERGASVVVETAPELASLLRTVPDVSEIVMRGGPYPHCDLQCPMMSLPLRCGTRAETIPAPVRYLDVDPMRVTRWQQLLGARTKPRIGLAWAGNPAHVRDRFRSMALECFVPLLGLRDFEWIGLQKGAASDQIATLPPGCGILDMGRHSETFADLAALIELLDVVITVDTSVVHVAGALGKPTLLLLDAAHDWRWPRSGTHARWYPSVQIVRQPSRGDWAGAIELAAEALRRIGSELSPATFSSRKSRAPCP